MKMRIFSSTFTCCCCCCCCCLLLTRKDPNYRSGINEIIQRHVTRSRPIMLWLSTWFATYCNLLQRSSSFCRVISGVPVCLDLYCLYCLSITLSVVWLTMFQWSSLQMIRKSILLLIAWTLILVKHTLDLVAYLTVHWQLKLSTISV